MADYNGGFILRVEQTRGEVSNGEFGEYERWFVQFARTDMCFVELVRGFITLDQAHELVKLLNKSRDFRVIREGVESEG